MSDGHIQDNLIQRELVAEPTTWTDEPSDPTLLRAVSTVLRYRFAILRLVLVGGLAAAVITFLLPRTYTSEFSFTPQEASAKMGLSALASDLGVNVGGSASQSPAFYVDLLKTRKVLVGLADQRVPNPSQPKNDSVTLGGLVTNKGATPALRRAYAVEKLQKLISARADIRTNVVDVAVKTRSPILSAQLASGLVSEVNRFNSETRRSQAAAEREFAEQRVSEAQRALRDAEDRDQSFLLRNMSINSSPELLFQKARLDREVGLRAEEYQALISEYNRARLDEVRNIPVITIIEQPEVAPRPDSRGVLTKTFIASTLSGLLGIFVAFLRESLTKSRKGEREEIEEFKALRAAAAADLRHPARTLRHILPSRGRTAPGAADGQHIVVS